MKTNNQSTTAKEIRLAEALKLASSHKGFQLGTIETNENGIFGTMKIHGVLLVLDIIEDEDGDAFRVHSPKWLPMPSIEAACVISNQTNARLMVAKVVIEKGHLGVFAHEFIGNYHLPAEANLMRLIDDVLGGIVLILEQHSLLTQDSTAMNTKPDVQEFSLN